MADPVTPAGATEVVAAVWVPCPVCWGQRRLWEDASGEGLVPHVCPACLGIGERLLLGG
jgi:hypothetical protein